jgi:hypothetical protein
MEICRLKPDHNTCCSCIDTQIDAGEKIDCNGCPEHSWVRLLHLGRTIFGKDYAYVYGPITDWKIIRVDAARLGVCTYVPDDVGELKIYNKHNKLLEKSKKKEG